MLFVLVFRNLLLVKVTLKLILLLTEVSANIRHFLHAVAGFISHPGAKKIYITPVTRSGITVSQPLTERLQLFSNVFLID
ncbi:hypothetical protein KLPMMMO223M1_22750 [Klebsiella pneumoniae]